MKTISHLSALSFLSLVALACDMGPNPWPVKFKSDVEVLQEGAGEEFGPELFPLNAGEKRVYYSLNTYLVDQVDDLTTRINGEETRIIKRTGVLYAVDWYLRPDEAGLWDFGDMTDFYPFGLPRLLFPVRVGKRWLVKSKDFNLEILAVVKTREKIETAMGEYDALKVEYWFGGEQNVLTDPDQAFWFAPGAGLVKFRKTYNTFLLRHSSGL